MDPVILTAISIGTTALGAGVSAFGSMKSGEAQAGMYNYQASIAKVNQQIAKQNADYALAAGEVEAQRSGMKTRAQIGETRAIQGASGLDVNTGSAARVRTSEAEIGLQDQALIRSNAARRAYGYEVEGEQQKSQASLYGMAAENASSAGKIGALSSILGGASSVSSKWLQASQIGVGSGGGGIVS